MSTPDVARARSFVQQAEVPAVHPELLSDTPPPGEQSPFDAARQQAAVVGSDVMSFVNGITPEQRKDIVNASLLAQLVSNKKVPDPEDLSGVLAWYKQYFDVLQQIGFTVQSKGFARYVEKADSFEAHEAILDVVKTALAGAPAALPLVIKTLESLKKMSENTPWITLFHRESRSANTARFQVSLADTEPNGAFLNLFAFGLSAKATVTQVLFFRFKKNESELQHNSSKLSINDTVLAGVRSDIEHKIAKFTKDFVAGLDV
jgi:hypothetical protein